MEPIIGMEDPWRYRNKAQFPFGMNKENEVIAGFMPEEPIALLRMTTACLAFRRTREILAAVKTDYDPIWN